MRFSPLIKREQSQLVIIDIQEKLAAAMATEAMVSLTRQCGILLQAAHLLDVPAIYTEQYPKGLGSTIAPIQQLLVNAPRIEKTAFSSYAVPAFREQLDAAIRPQIILAGMEAHICVLQTALHLQEHGYQVIVAEDAVLSRNPLNKANALQRLRQANVIVSNIESIAFEWLEAAEGDAFKAISRLVR